MPAPATPPVQTAIKRARNSAPSSDFIDTRINEVCAKLRINCLPEMRAKLHPMARDAALKVITIEAVAAIHSEQLQSTIKKLAASQTP